MDLTWINVVDTAVKIGLGALISAASGYGVPHGVYPMRLSLFTAKVGAAALVLRPQKF
ncbi:MAG: hypothetical protein ACI93R_003716 [Flavobacteriales bacterium]|jgi:hypothetical protein